MTRRPSVRAGSLKAFRKAYLSTWVAVVIWVQLMPFNLIRVEPTHCSFRQLLADTWIKLAHLRSLTNSITDILEVISGLDSALSG
jgi:hypothetical protein